MKVLLAKPIIHGTFQCIKCSSILEVHEHDITSEDDGTYGGFECPICKTFNNMLGSIDVDFLLIMRGIRNEITSDNLEIRRTEKYLVSHMYYKGILIGTIYYGTIDSSKKKRIRQCYYNNFLIFQKEYISEDFDPDIEGTKALFLNKIKEVDPVIEEYAELQKPRKVMINNRK